MKVYLQPADVVIEIDDADLPAFSRVKWGIIRPGKHCYAYGRFEGRPVLLHRYLLNPPDDMVVDHKDRNGLNNTRNNLRVVTQQANTWNRRIDFGQTGIYPQGDQFQAAMHIDGRFVVLGVYPDKQGAMQARDYFSLCVRGDCGGLHGVDLEGFEPLSLYYTARRMIAEAAA